MKKIFLVSFFLNTKCLDYKKTSYRVYISEYAGTSKIDFNTNDRKIPSLFVAVGTLSPVYFNLCRLLMISGGTILGKEVFTDCSTGFEISMDPHFFVRVGACIVGKQGEPFVGYFIQICYSYCKDLYVALKIRSIFKFDLKTGNIIKSKSNLIVDIAVGWKFYLVSETSFDELTTGAAKFENLCHIKN